MPKTSKINFAKQSYFTKTNLPGLGLSNWDEGNSQLQVNDQDQFLQRQSRQAEQKVNPNPTNAGAAQKSNGY